MACRVRPTLPVAEAPVLPTAQDLLAHLDVERSRIRGIRTLAESEIVGPDGRFKFSEILVVEPPARLRIEVLSTFGVVWILATDGEGLDIYSREEATVYRGKPTPEVVAYHLPVPLALEELTELLLGRPPPRDLVTAESVAWEPATRLIRLTLRLDGGGTETIWFDDETRLLRRCEERNAEGALRFDLRVTRYRDVRGVLLGSDLTIIAPHGVQVHLAYGRPELNPELPAQLFRIPPVLGAREARLGAHTPSQ